MYTNFDRYYHLHFENKVFPIILPSHKLSFFPRLFQVRISEICFYTTLKSQERMYEWKGYLHKSEGRRKVNISN